MSTWINDFMAKLLPVATTVIGGVVGGPVGAGIGGALGGGFSSAMRGNTTTQGLLTSGALGGVTGYAGARLLSGLGSAGAGAGGGSGAGAGIPSYGGGLEESMANFYGPTYGGAATSAGQGGSSILAGSPNQPSLVSGEGSLGLTGSEAPAYEGVGLDYGDSLGTTPTVSEAPGATASAYPRGPQAPQSAFTVDEGLTQPKSLWDRAGAYMPNKNMALTMLAGGALDYAGSAMNARAQAKGLEDYRNATSWTPDRSNTYLTNLSNLVRGTYAGEEAKRKKSVAEILAGSGRGGGGYGRATESLGRERRETEAKLLAGGLMNVSQPPQYPVGAFPMTSPEGQAMSNVGGLIGRYGTTAQQMAMIQAMMQRS